MQKTYIAKNEHISILHSTHYVDNLRFLGTPPPKYFIFKGGVSQNGLFST